MQESLQSGTNKHRAGSPLESIAKRGRHDPVGYHSSELLPYSARFHASTMSTINSLAGMTSTEFPCPPVIDALFDPAKEARDFGYSNMVSQLEFADWAFASTSSDPYYIEPASMNPGIDVSQTYSPMDRWAQSSLYKISLEDSKPADFLAIRKTQGRRSC